MKSYCTRGSTAYQNSFPKVSRGMALQMSRDLLTRQLLYPDCLFQNVHVSKRRKQGDRNPKVPKKMGLQTKSGHRFFPLIEIRELLDNDVMILKYLFSDFRKAEDRFSRGIQSAMRARKFNSELSSLLRTMALLRHPIICRSPLEFSDLDSLV